MGNNGELHCDQNYSELSNCPHGNALGAKFRQCSFPTMGESSFQLLQSRLWFDYPKQVMESKLKQ